MKVPNSYAGWTGVVVGTGPSLSDDQISLIKCLRALDKVRVFGCNNTLFTPLQFSIDVHLACNVEWWAHYGKRVTEERQVWQSFWTWDRGTALHYSLNHVEGVWADGMSRDPNRIHYGHSSGFQLMNLAYLYGCTTLVLVGYDMRYGPGYDASKKIPGEKRHFFGEYPKPLQHWPQVGKKGEFTGLLNVFRTVRPADYGIRIVNCSPGSALDFYETSTLREIYDNLVS